MSSAGTFDTDELRALAVALDVLDPENPEDWEGDATAFEASVARGRARLEQRGIATFARDGGAEVDAAEAGLLRAFLDPDAVIEAWIVDGSVALRREWYVGPEVTVVADPGAVSADEPELATIDTREVLADVVAFLDPRGVDAEGEPVPIVADALDDFRGHAVTTPDAARPATRLMNVATAWRDGAAPSEVQILDAGPGGLWLLGTEDEADTGGDEPQDAPDVVELTPATRAEIIERVLTALTPERSDVA